MGCNYLFQPWYLLLAHKSSYMICGDHVMLLDIHLMSNNRLCSRCVSVGAGLSYNVTSFKTGQKLEAVRLLLHVSRRFDG